MPGTGGRQSPRLAAVVTTCGDRAHGQLGVFVVEDETMLATYANLLERFLRARAHALDETTIVLVQSSS